MYRIDHYLGKELIENLTARHACTLQSGVYRQSLCAWCREPVKKAEDPDSRPTWGMPANIVLGQCTDVCAVQRLCTCLKRHLEVELSRRPDISYKNFHRSCVSGHVVCCS